MKKIFEWKSRALRITNFQVSMILLSVLTKYYLYIFWVDKKLFFNWKVISFYPFVVFSLAKRNIKSWFSKKQKI